MSNEEEQAKEMFRIVQELTSVQHERLQEMVFSIARCFNSDDKKAVVLIRESGSLRAYAVNAAEEEVYNICRLSTVVMAEAMIPTEGEVH